MTELLVGNCLSEKYFGREVVPGSKPCTHVDVVMAMHRDDQDLCDRINGQLQNPVVAGRIQTILNNFR